MIKDRIGPNFYITCSQAIHYQAAGFPDGFDNSRRFLENRQEHRLSMSAV